jgi:non-specific serine/threonine protein kinase
VEGAASFGRGLARFLVERGDAAQAAAHYEEALRLARLGGGLHEQGKILLRLDFFALHQRDLPRASALLREALARLRDGGSLHNVPVGLAGLAGVAAAQGRPERAARLCGAATAELVRRYGREWMSDPADLADVERVVAAVRATLAEPALGAAWAAGQVVTLEQAIEEALSDEAPPAAVPRGDGAGGPLTRRELEVAALVARGLSYREVAARLVITPRTAETHVVHILGKLGFASRAQIAAWAVEQGLRAAPPE